MSFNLEKSTRGMRLVNEFDFKKFNDLNVWSRNYIIELNRLEGDLEFILNRSGKIFLAVDSYDLISHVFPEKYIESKGDKELVIKRTIARGFLLNQLMAIYTYPLILLPPHLTEIIDLFKIIRNDLDSSFNLQYEEDLKNQIDSILFQLEDSNDSEVNQLLTELEKNSPMLGMIFSPYFMSGLNGLTSILREKISPNPSSIEKYGNISFIEDIENKYYKEIKKIRPAKTIPNIRDSMAIQYIEELNNRMDKDELLLFVSSSEVFDLFIESNAIFRSIHSRRYELIRGMVTFYFALIEANLLLSGYGENDPLKTPYDLTNQQLTLLLKEIKYKCNLLKLIGNITDGFVYSIESGSLSGRYAQSYLFIEEIYTLKGFMEEREKDIILSYINHYFNYDDISYLNKYCDDEIIKNLQRLVKEISSKEFTSMLQGKISEIDEQICIIEEWIEKNSSNHINLKSISYNDSLINDD